MLAILLLAFTSLTSASPVKKENSPLSDKPYITTSEVDLIDLQSNDTVLAWIDVQARVSESDSKYLPADPALFGINWIMICFDPEIDQNNLFWVLAQVRVGLLPQISHIPWVKNISLIKAGGYERLSKNPKFAAKGIEYAIQRTVSEGSKSLQVIVYVANPATPIQGKHYLTKEAILARVTMFVHQLGGEVLKVGLYVNDLVAEIPSEMIETLTTSPYVSEIYLQGPVVFE
jgi:hypothetical protein